MGTLALATIVIPSGPTERWLVVAAVALTALIALGALAVPWSRLPRYTYVLPPLAYFVVIGLLRESQGGSASGYAPLAILPVLWIALTLGRWEVAIGSVAGAVLFLAPLVYENDAFTASEWRRAILWTGVSLVVGFSVEELMRGVRVEAAGRAASGGARGERADDGEDRADRPRGSDLPGRPAARVRRRARDRGRSGCHGRRAGGRLARRNRVGRLRAIRSVFTSPTSRREARPCSWPVTLSSCPMLGQTLRRGGCAPRRRRSSRRSSSRSSRASEPSGSSPSAGRSASRRRATAMLRRSRSWRSRQVRRSTALICSHGSAGSR